MKINRTILFILLFVVVGAALWYTLQRHKSKSTINTEDRKFAIENTEDIHKIFLAKKGSDPITLERGERAWLVNQRYRAFSSAIDNLLDVMSKLSIKSIPPRAAYEVIMKDFADVGLKVEAYNATGKLLKSYYIGGVTNDETGVYFLMDGYRQPYAMHLNKRQSNIRHRYDIALDDWRDRSLIPLRSDEIEAVEIQFPYNPVQSFRIQKIGGEYKLSSAARPDQLEKTPSQTFIKSYIENLSLAPTEAFQNKNPAKELTASWLPYLRIAVKSKIQTDSLIVNLFPINEEKEQPVDLSAEFLARGRFFRFYANRSDGDFLILQIQQILPILKTLDQMRKEE